MHETPQPVKRPPAGKVIVALILIIFGSVLVFGSVVLFSSLVSPQFELSAGKSFTRAGPIALEANRTMEVGIAFMSTGVLDLTWTATAPISVYLLNESQYTKILPQRVNDDAPFFPEQPIQYLRKYFNARGQEQVSLPKGNYHLLAFASSSTVLGDLILSFPSREPPITPPFSSGVASLLPFVIAGAEGAIGVLVIVLGVLILAKRFWASNS